MKAHFETMAAYNRWANHRLYAAVSTLDETDRWRDLGAFFGGLHRTLNHILATDVIWLARLRSISPPKWTLDHIAHENFSALTAAREALDADIDALVREIDDFHAIFTYTNLAGDPFAQPFHQALTHLFNHQTHHRGQCHGMLTRLTGNAPALDLIQFLRAA